MRSCRHRGRLPVFLLILSFGSVVWCSGEDAEDPPLEIKFGDKTASFSGVIDSEETGQILARTIKSARPDLDIVNDGLIVREGASLPPLEELKSLLSEIGISTHEGGLEISNDEFRISGLTDSVVTVTALMIRLEPIKGDRQLINHICIVPSEDLPDLGVSLSGNETGGPLINFDKRVTVEEAFESPGIPLSKVSALVDFARDLEVLAGEKPYQEPSVIPDEIRAVPMITQASLSMGTETSEPVQRVILATPLTAEDLTPPPLELDPIRFSRNTVILQNNQTPLVTQWITILNEAEFSGQPITIRALKPAAGSNAFNEWLCERRASEVKAILSKNGIDESLCSIEIRSTESNMDMGEVVLSVERKLVELPIETEGVPEASETGETTPSETSNVSSSPTAE